MTKSKFVLIALALALVVWTGASVASAQDGPSIIVTPSNVDSAGQTTFEVNGSGWTASAITIVRCGYGADVDPKSLDIAAHCGIGGFGTNYTMDDLTQDVAVTDGSFSRTIVADIPEQGLILVAGAQAPQESAHVFITVGDDMMDDMLADTGVNTALLVIIGIGIALAGIMVFGFSRRLQAVR